MSNGGIIPIDMCGKAEDEAMKARQKSIEVWMLTTFQGQKMVLLLHVPPSVARRPKGFWQPITGGVHAGETAEEACLREIKEETGKNLKSFLKDQFTDILPEKQKKEIIDILSTSPSALDYFLNLRSADRLRLFIIILRFYLSPIFLVINQFIKLEFEKKQTSFISQIVSSHNVMNDNPLLTVLRSFFIVDSFNGNIVENEYSSKKLREILLPKVIQ